MQHAIEFDPTPSQESGDIRTNAERWMIGHPEALALLESLALTAAARGRRFGIGLLAERLRWHYAIEYGDEQFKVNNNYRSILARWLIAKHPHLKDFMSVRALRCA